jgi:PAS domain S-box-containing protein
MQVGREKPETTEQTRLTRALPEAEELGRLLLESADEGVYGVDLDGKATFLNATAEHMLGWEADELLGRPIHHIIGDASGDEGFPPGCQCLVCVAYRDGVESQLYEGSFSRKDGSSFAVEYSARPIYRNGGRIGAVVVFRDITRRKNVETSLHRYMERLEILHKIDQSVLAAESPGAIASAAVQRIPRLIPCQRVTALALEDDGQISLSAAVSTDGISSNSDYGAYSELLFHNAPLGGGLVVGCADLTALPHHTHLQRSLYQAGMRSYMAVPLSAETGLAGILVLESTQPKAFTPDHITIATEVAGSLAVAIRHAHLYERARQDLFERMQAEEALRESEERLQLALEATREGLWDWDLRANKAYFSPSFYTILGYEPDEFPASFDAWRALLHTDDIQRTVRTIMSHAETGEPVKLEYRMIAKDGGWKWILGRGRTVAWDESGRPVRMVGTHADITEQKRMEAELLAALDVAEGASQAKSVFLANMSHEIRTPMNAVIGLSHLLFQTELTRQQRNYLAKIQSAAQSLLSIISDVLDFSDIEAERMQMESVPFELNQVFENLEASIRPKADEKGLEVAIAVALGVPSSLVGDPRRLEQVLLKLGSNAVKYTDTGGIAFSAAVLQEADDRVELQFSVRDTGIGINSEQAGVLFQAFSQVDGSSTREYGGTGLGLAICKHLVEMMNGKIWVESQPGEGSTFHFTSSFRRPVEKDLHLIGALAQSLGATVPEVIDGTTAQERGVDSMDDLPQIEERRISVDGATLAPLLQELAGLLDVYDTDASLVMQAVRREVGLPTVQQELRRVERLIEQYDFEGARKSLEEVAQELDIVLSGEWHGQETP